MARDGGLQTHALGESDPLDGFVCAGYPALEDFIRNKAPRNQRERYGRTFVLRGEIKGQPAILGYYSLVMTSVGREILPRKKRQGTPESIPVALIGRLAVDDRVQGRGYGGILLKDALLRVHAAAEQLGCFAVIVDAKDENAEDFYLHHGFEKLPVEGSPKRLFLKVEVVDGLIAEQRQSTFLGRIWSLVMTRLRLRTGR
jgi:GNAT superfamily N-acetyltransferase